MKKNSPLIYQEIIFKVKDVINTILTQEIK